MRDKVDIFQKDKHLSFLQVDIIASGGRGKNTQRTQNNKIKIRVFYMFISSFLVATASYAQSSQNNKFSILPMIVSNLKNKEIDQGSSENVLLFGLLKFVVFFYRYLY